MTMRAYIGLSWITTHMLQPCFPILPISFLSLHFFNESRCGTQFKHRSRRTTISIVFFPLIRYIIYRLFLAIPPRFHLRLPSSFSHPLLNSPIIITILGSIHRPYPCSIDYTESPLSPSQWAARPEYWILRSIPDYSHSHLHRRDTT